MLGFTLSKLNLLILVTAMFAIIAYFMLHLTDLVVGYTAQQMVNSYAEDVAGIAMVPELCWKSPFTMPEAIYYFGSKRFFYVMKISKLQKSFESSEINSVVFSIADRGNYARVRAARNIDIDGDIRLYDWNPDTSILAESGEIIMDPISIPNNKDSLYIIKEIYKGKAYLHIIACSAVGGICEDNLQRAGCCIAQHRSNAASICVPPAENCQGAMITCEAD